jgi:Zn-dependent protease
MFTIFELLDIVVMTFVVGYLFHDIFRKPKQSHDVLDQYRAARRGPLGIDWHDFWWAAALVAPSIVIHEFGHKFVALGFGLTAEFHAACSTSSLAAGGLFGMLDFYCGLTLLVLVLKAMGSGFLIFVPAFVAVGGGGTPLQYAMVSFAGPLVHLIFWLGAAWYLKDKRRVKRLPHKKVLYLFFFKQINMFLFILNMTPIPGFDGFSVFYNLFRTLF